MRIYASCLLVVLCASQPWGASAFSVPSPRKPSFALQSTAVSSEWNIGNNVRVEGQTRTTFQFGDHNKEVVQVAIRTEGRPTKADVELWIGPDWTPLTINCYSEDGLLRPIQTLVGTRNKAANIEVRNTGPYEFPLIAAAQYAQGPLSGIRTAIAETSEPHYVEGGGAIYSVPLAPDTDQVEVLLNTDARQLNAMIELLNGPNNVKQGFKIFTNNGLLNSLYVIFNTPGGGNTIRVKNIAPLEFPCKAYISERGVSSSGLVVQDAEAAASAAERAAEAAREIERLEEERAAAEAARRAEEERAAAAEAARKAEEERAAAAEAARRADEAAAESDILVQKIEKASAALSEIPALVAEEEWVKVVGVLAGPMGELRDTMDQLCGLSENPDLCSVLAETVKADISALAVAVSKEDGDSALEYHQLATEHLVDFVKVL